MIATRSYRIFGTLAVTSVSFGDVDIVFFKDADDVEQVRLVLADGRAYTRLTLGDFCLLLSEVRKEIARRHWAKPESLEAALANTSDLFSAGSDSNS